MEHPVRDRELGVWLDDQPVDLVRAHLAEHGAGWSVGTWGAIGEFSFTADETDVVVDVPGITARSRRGALRASLPQACRALAISGERGLREIAFCLPADAMRGAARRVLTETGPDRDAVAGQDRDGVVFDLGIGMPHLDVCVRVLPDDEATLAALRRGCRRPLFEGGNPAVPALQAASPARLFLSGLARLEVCTPIPPAGGRSPEGPHSHLLPALLAEARTHAPGSPIPPGWICGLSLYPAQRR
jgi:hypothetical protein